LTGRISIGCRENSHKNSAKQDSLMNDKNRQATVLVL
jgi:hypothetical protein